VEKAYASRFFCVGMEEGRQNLSFERILEARGVKPIRTAIPSAAVIYQFALLRNRACAGTVLVERRRFRLESFPQNTNLSRSRACRLQVASLWSTSWQTEIVGCATSF
jgi:hypothetical protein